MYNVSIDTLLSNYIGNIIDYILCFTTTHFLYDQVTIILTVSPFSSTTYIYNFETTCYIMIVAALEKIYIYQSYGTSMEFIILKCIFYYYTLSNRAYIDFNQTLTIQKTHSVLMLSICHLIYVSIYACCSKLIFYAFQHDLYIKA